MYNSKQSLVRDLKELTWDFIMWTLTVIVLLPFPFSYFVYMGIKTWHSRDSAQKSIIIMSAFLVLVGIVIIITMIWDYRQSRNQLRNQINKL